MGRDNDTTAADGMTDEEAFERWWLKQSPAPTAASREDTEGKLREAQKSIQSLNAVIADWSQRFSYLFDAYRDGRSNEEIAERCRSILTDWDRARAALASPSSPPPDAAASPERADQGADIASRLRYLARTETLATGGRATLNEAANMLAADAGEAKLREAAKVADSLLKEWDVGNTLQSPEGGFAEGEETFAPADRQSVIDVVTRALSSAPAQTPVPPPAGKDWAYEVADEIRHDWICYHDGPSGTVIDFDIAKVADPIRKAAPPYAPATAVEGER